MARKDQLGIGDERTGVHRMDGQRIQGIMLKDGDQTAPSCNPMQLSEPHRGLVMSDVVKHARRKHNIEG
jgi:hypothetical protein